ASTATSARCATSCRARISSPNPIQASSSRRSVRATGRFAERGTRMSLLLEALKKAERAKEEAQRRVRGEGASAAPPAEASAAQRKPVMTRDKLPEITAPLEIVTEDLVPPPS